jgi:hypothetical protein
MRKKTAAKIFPTTEEISVALSAPRRVASSARRILPPSSGKAGRRLKTARNDVQVAQIEEELPHRPDTRE